MFTGLGSVYSDESVIVPHFFRANIMTPCRSLLVFALAALLAGCANFSSVQSGMPEQQVQAKLGKPGAVWKNPDGSEVWEYAQGPYGRQNYMVTMGPDHAMREIHQVLSDEYFSKVHTGMSRDEVRRTLGAPAETMVFNDRGEEVWSWRFQDLNPMWFHVMFDRSAGTVRSTLRIEEILHQDPTC